MDDKYKRYLQSHEWAQIKNDLFDIRGRNCERCGSSYGLQIHHKTYERLYNEEPKDLEILCAGCHSKEHNIKTKRKNSVKIPKSKFNENTVKMFEDGLSSNGGYSRKQLELLGITWNTLRRRWKKRLMRNEYSPEIRQQFIELKDKHL